MNMNFDGFQPSKADKANALVVVLHGLPTTSAPQAGETGKKKSIMGHSNQLSPLSGAPLSRRSKSIIDVPTAECASGFKK
jgi:hypothetical protein